MIILSNAHAIEMLTVLTDPDAVEEFGTDEQYAAMCELLAKLQQDDCTQQLMITPVADQDPDLGNVVVCPTGNCPMPILNPPVPE